MVDGNVIRVLTRLRSVGLETNDRRVINWLWQTVDDLVDRDEPGEFNQAIMELGALVCTPKSPSCSSCPLNSYCWALRKVTYNNMSVKINEYFIERERVRLVIKEFI